MSRTVAAALRRGLMVYGDDASYEYRNGRLQVVGSAPLVIGTEGPTTDWISVQEGVQAHLTLAGVDIEPRLGGAVRPAVLVCPGASLNLVLEGANMVESGWGRAGIELDDATLVIDQASTGSLVAKSDYGAAIGGGVVADASYGGSIIINGGTVYALGGRDSAGIGCGAGWPGDHDIVRGFDVTINGGSVFAKGDGAGSGIGGSHGRPCGGIRINGGYVQAVATGATALGGTPRLEAYRRSQVLGGPAEESFVVRPLPFETPGPIKIKDMSEVHEDSIPWTTLDEGVLHATGFNDANQSGNTNHACVDVTYELGQPGAIAYRWKVTGADSTGGEIFDRYWFLKGSDGTFRSGSDFLGEHDNYQLHLIDGLDEGTYQLTLGVFCFGADGAVTLDLTPCA